MTTLLAATEPGELHRLPHNDYSSLRPPPLGEWAPHLPVSVVTPAYGDQDKLDLTLASLAAQTYPSHLLEVVVVDDGTEPPLRLPEIAPANTRIVTGASGGWGIAHAFHAGVLAAQGRIIQRLDADMVVYREHIEAQARWHHLASYLVVLGYKRFISYTTGEVSASEAYDAVSRGSADELFDLGQSLPHDWVERAIDQTDGLRAGGHLAFRAHVGATSSLTTRLYHEAGGMDISLTLGEDTELGYRLAQTGAVFIPDNEARSWHLGFSSMMRRQDDANRFNGPFLSNRLPQPRRWRQGKARQWLVPYIDVAIDAAGASYEDVRTSAEGALNGSLPDVQVTLTGAWSALTEERRSPLDDPQLDLRLLREAYRCEGRARLIDTLPKTSFPASFRFTCPAGWVPEPDALQRLVEFANKHGYGLVSLALAGTTELTAARLERTAAFTRALRLRRATEELDDVVDETFGTHWLDGAEWGVVPAAETAGNDTDWQSEVARWQREARKWKGEAEQLQQQLERRRLLLNPLRPLMRRRTR